MELKKQIDALGNFIPLVLKYVTKMEFKEKEWDFIYGSQEYNRSIKKHLKQLQRIWR